MSFDDIKAHLDRLFAYRPTGSTREQAAGLREALIEFKVAIGELQETLSKAEGRLEKERTNVVDYQRRLEMAVKIDDTETAQVAEDFLAKAQERVDLLERKVIVLRDELVMAQREYDSTRARYQSAARGLPHEETTQQVNPDTGESELVFEDPSLDQHAKEAAVEAQLEVLKKKLRQE